MSDQAESEPMPCIQIVCPFVSALLLYYGVTTQPVTEGMTPSACAIAIAVAVLQHSSDTPCAWDASVYVNFGFGMDTPLFKKYAVMNSGLMDASRYNDTIIQSIGDIKARRPLRHSLSLL